jgi:polysaccharide export outer membrane protein
MIRIIFWLVALVLVLGACVPNKRLIYLQNDPEPKRGEVVNADSIARTYTTRLTDYTLKPLDIISLNVASITPGEFDFVKKYEEQLGLFRKLGQYNQGNQTGNTQRITGVGGVGQSGEGISPLSLDRQPTGFELDAAGNLELPFIGMIKLSGLTLPQTETLLKEKLKGYFETPVVRVQLLTFHFTILGEVNEEGRYTSYNPNTSLIDAVTLAGNLNDFADRSKVKVVRYNGDIASVFYVDMLAEDLLGQPGYFLQPNDLIIVPPLKARFLKKYGLQGYAAALTLITSTITMLVLIASLNDN